MGPVNIAELRATYFSLAVASCEWRAYGIADPTAMANVAFATLDARKDQSLRQLFRAIDTAVADAYRRHAGTHSVLDRLRTGTTMGRPAQRTPEEDYRDALSRLRQADRALLQHRFWDDLNDAEMAEVLRLSQADVQDRLANAGVRYLAKLAKTHPEVALSDVGDVLRQIRPGENRR